MVISEGSDNFMAPYKKPRKQLCLRGNLFLNGSTNHVNENRFILKIIFLSAMHAERGAYIYGIGGCIVRCTAANTRR